MRSHKEVKPAKEADDSSCFYTRSLWFLACYALLLTRDEADRVKLNKPDCCVCISTFAGCLHVCTVGVATAATPFSAVADAGAAAHSFFSAKMSTFSLTRNDVVASAPHYQSMDDMSSPKANYKS